MGEIQTSINNQIALYDVLTTNNLINKKQVIKSTRENSLTNQNKFRFSLFSSNELKCKSKFKNSENQSKSKFQYNLKGMDYNP